jgi:hypothetical protein
MIDEPLLLLFGDHLSIYLLCVQATRHNNHRAPHIPEHSSYQCFNLAPVSQPPAVRPIENLYVTRKHTDQINYINKLKAYA